MSTCFSQERVMGGRNEHEKLLTEIFEGTNERKRDAQDIPDDTERR